MNPLDTVKAYANHIIGAVLLLAAGYFTWWWHHDGYLQGLKERDKVQVAWNAEKAANEAAAKKQAAEAAAKDAEQLSITKRKESEYEKVKFERDVALAKFRKYRLCPVEDLSGGGAVRVAEGTKATVPEQAQSSAGTSNTAAMAAGFTFEDALRDHDQCKALIEWNIAQGM